MYLELVITSSNRDLNRMLRTELEGNELIKVDKGTKAFGENKRQFSVTFNLLERSDIYKYLNVKDDHIEFYGIDFVIGEVIKVDKETATGYSKNFDASFELKNKCIDHNSFPWLSYSFGWQQTIKPWEDWNDLLFRIPRELQDDVFTSTICTLPYMDIEEIYNSNFGSVDFKLCNTKEVIFYDHARFMQHMEERDYVDMNHVREYMKNRLDAGINLNKIIVKKYPKDFDYDSLQADVKESV